jgi:hypothetical protein
MALRRLIIDIEYSGEKEKNGRPLYGLSIRSSVSGEKSYEDLRAGKLHTLIEFAVDDALDTLKF